MILPFLVGVVLITFMNIMKIQPSLNLWTLFYYAKPVKTHNTPPEPNINNLELFIVPSCLAMYGNSLKCDQGFRSGFNLITNYEKREEVSMNNFEFTYRFTEATKEAAASCE